MHRTPLGYVTNTLLLFALAPCVVPPSWGRGGRVSASGAAVPGYGIVTHLSHQPSGATRQRTQIGR